MSKKKTNLLLQFQRLKHLSVLFTVKIAEIELVLTKLGVFYVQNVHSNLYTYRNFLLPCMLHELYLY